MLGRRKIYGIYSITYYNVVGNDKRDSVYRKVVSNGMKTGDWSYEETLSDMFCKELNPLSATDTLSQTLSLIWKCSQTVNGSESQGL